CRFPPLRPQSLVTVLPSFERKLTQLMYLHQSRIRHIASIVAAALLLAGSAAAETKPRLDLSKIQIKNFGRTNDNYFRGAQPSDRDYSDLAAVGVRTVIDLTKDGKKDEAQLVSLSGM